MKVREDFTLGRLQVGVCGLPHSRLMYFLALKNYCLVAGNDRRHTQPFCAPDQVSAWRLLHDGSPYAAIFHLR